MPRLNPVRGHYMLQGLDLVRAGIQRGVFIREDNKAALPSIDPRTERWLTSRAVSRAAALAHVDLNLAQVEASVILPYVQQDPKAKVRTTEEQIVHMCGGESPENRAYAQSQIELLEKNYSIAKAKSA